MIDAPTQAVLLNIVRRHRCSLLQYVHDAFPWTTAGEQDAVADLRRLIHDDRDAIAAIVRFLQRHHVTVPPFGSYPMAFTSINYVTLDHLLPLLADHERRAIAELETDLPRVTDAEAHDAVQQYLQMQRRHQKALEAMAAAHPEPALR